MSDLKALSESLLSTIKGFVERKTAELVERLSRVERAVAELPAPKDGHTPTSEEIQPLVEAAVERAVKELPAPKDGHTPTSEEIQPLVEAAVERAVAELPAPKDGHTPTPEEIQPLVEAAVERAVEPLQQRAIENTEAILGRIRHVERAVAELPAPKDGKSVTADDVKPMLADMVLEATRSASEPAVKAYLDSLVAQCVAEAVKALPKPADGRDALDLHVLPAINAEKSYPRGTFAKHLGGLWRAFEATDGMRGWECIVEGLVGVDVAQEGDRKFVVTATTSSGASTAKEFTVPVMIYRGIYREQTTYDEGDTVTWAGSTWVCRRVTSDKPGQSDAWGLSVKKGRDGKDAEGVKL